VTEKISANRDMIEGERKPATVLFCDMEDFTPLVEKLDTEEAYADLRGLQPYIPHLPWDWAGPTVLCQGSTSGRMRMTVSSGPDSRCLPTYCRKTASDFLNQ
jgi:hypothetical protein